MEKVFLFWVSTYMSIQKNSDDVADVGFRPVSDIRPKIPEKLGCPSDIRPEVHEKLGCPSDIRPVI